MSGPAIQRRHSKRLERKSSAAPYSANEKGGGSSGLTGYMADAKLDFDEDEELKPKRTLTFMRRNKKAAAEPKKDGGEAEQGFFARTFTFTKNKKKEGAEGEVKQRQGSFGRRKPKAKEAGASSKAGSSGAGGGRARSGSVQKTVFISCSALIREVKLCVGDELQEGLEELLHKLTAQEIPAEQAVKKLMGLVGSTIVQQAGLSVMNAQKGILPHGWLEYTDEGSNRPYYYNVHTKVTTWYKPAMRKSTVAHVNEPMDPNDGGMISVDCAVETHSIALSGDI